MNACVEQYRKKLKKQLHCSASMQKQLLDSFEKSLSHYLEENTACTLEDIHAAFGTPEEMAEVLMAEVSEEEKAAYRKKRKMQRVLVWVLVPVMILLLWAAVLLMEAIDSHTEKNGYFDITVNSVCWQSEEPDIP